ncbi:MAG: hypothetical protein LRY73_09160 [Bacillus sp. (in: Bacteria)]|nr:hypothetical protein [Bacillus sp. (in: firmicutes)]
MDIMEKSEELVYELWPHRLINSCMIILLVLWNITVLNNDGIKFMLAFLFLLAAISVRLFFNCIHIKITIDSDQLGYEIVLFKKSIVKKRIMPEEINLIKFKEVGWFKRAAVINVKKGMDIRIIDNNPKKVYDDLCEFGERNDIKIIKTKDYLRLIRRGK